jgi:hypothetical protein
MPPTATSVCSAYQAAGHARRHGVQRSPRRHSAGQRPPPKTEAAPVHQYSAQPLPLSCNGLIRGRVQQSCSARVLTRSAVESLQEQVSLGVMSGTPGSQRGRTSRPRIKSSHPVWWLAASGVELTSSVAWCVVNSLRVWEPWSAVESDGRQPDPPPVPASMSWQL